MIKKPLIVILLFSSTLFAQAELKGNMGINFLSIPSMQDYINQNFAPADKQLPSFVTAVIFSGEGGLFVSNSFAVTLEASYQIYSYTAGGFGGQYELAFNNFMPSVLAYYVLAGKGYNFKFGGGVGVRLTSVDETRPTFGTTLNYSSTGFGGILRIEGNTLLGGSAYANIGLEMRYDANGEPENNGNKLYNAVLSENVNFNTFSVGIRLGITYIIGEMD